MAGADKSQLQLIAIDTDPQQLTQTLNAQGMGQAVLAFEGQKIGRAVAAVVQHPTVECHQLLQIGRGGIQHLHPHGALGLAKRSQQIRALAGKVQHLHGQTLRIALIVLNFVNQRHGI